MNNNPENRGLSGTLAEIWKQIKSYVGVEFAYVKVTSTEKLTILLSAVTIGAILIVICAMALFYLSLAMIFSMHTLVGGYHWAMFIAAGVLILLGLLMYIFRKGLIINPIARFLSKLFLDPPTTKSFKEDEEV